MIGKYVVGASLRPFERQPEYHRVLWQFKTMANHTKWRWRASCGYSQHSTGKPEWNKASSLTSEFFSNMVPVLRKIKQVLLTAHSFHHGPVLFQYLGVRIIRLRFNHGCSSVVVACIYEFCLSMCAIQTFAMASALQTICVCIAHNILTNSNKFKYFPQM